MSPVSGVCSRLLTFSGVALKNQVPAPVFGSGDFWIVPGSGSGSGCVPPAAKSCSLYEAPGLRPCVSKVSPSPCFRFGAGIFCFAPGGRWDCLRRAPRPAGSFSRTATPHGGWGSGSFAALFGGVFLPSPGCGALLLRRGTWPACKKQTAAPAPPRCICRRQRFGCAATRPQRLPHGCAIAPIQGL